jgi:transcriptional regulator with XRE-family HTH domain
MDRNERAVLFRQRLQNAMNHAGYNRAQLAATAGIDRSTLGQLLSDDETRLPNGHTLAELARTLHVSSDWLVALSQEAQPVTVFLDEAMNFAPYSGGAPIDDNLMRWYEDAAGFKIRHVPANLPDVLKTSEILKYEYATHAARSPDKAIADMQAKLDYIRLPETDLEICMPLQNIGHFAKGHGMWCDFEAQKRRDHLHYFADLVDELYPGLRVYGFNERTLYSAPYTIFGVHRAAFYIGQSYFVMNTTSHVRKLAKHFDNLIRNAEVLAQNMGDYLRGLDDIVPGK